MKNISNKIDDGIEIIWNAQLEINHSKVHEDIDNLIYKGLNSDIWWNTVIDEYVL